jgi:hypothetical protein
MTRMSRKAVAFAAVILGGVGAMTAYAATSPPNVGIASTAMNGVDKASGVNGALKANAVGNRQIKVGSISCAKFSPDVFAALCKGIVGEQGPAGPAGPAGTTGATGAAGPQGATGSKGDTGAPGVSGTVAAKGEKGDKGDPAPTIDYGIANVLVSRGVEAATPWAQYTADLGSPVGGTTGGVFRFTCTTSKAPCTISVQAAVEGQDTTKKHTLYPRLLVYNAGDGDGQGAPLTTCEYADGSTGAFPILLTNQGLSPTPTYTPVPVNIGGSDDCGLNGAAGNVAQITVPHGYYDVHATFAFGARQ